MSDVFMTGDQVELVLKGISEPKKPFSGLPDTREIQLAILDRAANELP